MLGRVVGAVRATGCGAARCGVLAVLLSQSGARGAVVKAAAVLQLRRVRRLLEGDGDGDGDAEDDGDAAPPSGGAGATAIAHRLVAPLVRRLTRPKKTPPPEPSFWLGLQFTSSGALPPNLHPPPECQG